MYMEDAMSLMQILARLGLALVLGAIIGAEREWRQKTAGIRTNALVAAGAALFIMLGAMMQHDTSPTRIAAQIVTGIGFLGAGVMMRDGLTVRGLNTAATLWCVGAIGALAGSGLLLHALVSSMVILGANILFFPLENSLMRHFQKTEENTVWYRLELICRHTDQLLLRSIILTIAGTYGVEIRGFEVHENASGIAIMNIRVVCRSKDKLESFMRRLVIEPAVNKMSWGIENKLTAYSESVNENNGKIQGC